MIIGPVKGGGGRKDENPSDKGKGLTDEKEKGGPRTNK